MFFIKVLRFGVFGNLRIVSIFRSYISFGVGVYFVFEVGYGSGWII